MAKKNNIVNKLVYKDFDDEEIPNDFIQEGWELKKDNFHQWIKDAAGEVRAMKCPSIKAWCQGFGKPGESFNCFGCPYLNGVSKDVLDAKKEEKQFIKNDNGKLQWSLMPFEQLEDVVRVLMNGAKKYSKDNWKKCDDITRYKDALMRHVVAYCKGEALDPEDCLPHLAHAICNCLFLMWFSSQEKIND